jgi:hypothetical protein
MAENDSGSEWEENVFIVRVKYKSLRYLACKISGEPLKT